jgi:hypothetical protein
MLAFNILYIVIPIAAIFLGITSLIQIEMSAGRVVGKGFAVIGIAIPVVLHLGMMKVVSYSSHRHLSLIVCGTNLSGLGKAMLIYSNDYDDALPSAGGPDGRWKARLPQWTAESREDAYGLSDPNATDGRASVSSSLYLLVKYYDVKPKLFICRGDRRITEFKPVKYDVDDTKLTDLWDFGPNPPKHCSYSYHQPYGPNRLTTSSEPGLAIAADRNPWMDSPFQKARDFQAFDPNGTPGQVRAGNAIAHKKDGQNVLFLDNHVGFEKRSFCGVNEDNIYTYWDGGDIRRGTPPRLGSQPADKSDSLLVNDPAIPK